ncbi:MAG: DUF1926 domain-containing protein [Candidatus Omnitrophica bacterium]|nr:DUF1926 domain-containing protein [Candidatus Omnitrophota bacterium]
MKAAKFAMAFHCYQPVFNFVSEFENAYEKAYLPLVDTLGGYPRVRASLHFSGNMLEWLDGRHPDYLDKLRLLLDRDQIEILGGGCYEPVMAIIPERDRVEQLRLTETLIQRLFGVKPEGAWLAERVWDPSLADTLSGAGIKYTIVDDHHLEMAGFGEKVFAPCFTSGEKGRVALFACLKALRYSIPFRPPRASIGYMKSIAAARGDEPTCFFFADDGEKFGAWPHTYRWVHKRGWLKSFFALLQDNASWLETVRYSDVLSSVECEEVGNVPPSSYAEMMGWSGGDFRNFLGKYPEADRMHKRMLSVSDAINAHGIACERTRAARKELFKAQSNCAYWHGTFGGLYLPHLRSGVYRHLIRAQDMIEPPEREKLRNFQCVEVDLGSAGSETLLGSGHLDIYISPGEGASVRELAHKASSSNLVNTLTRVKEKYHDKLGRGFSLRVRKARRAIFRGEHADIHDVLGAAEKGLKKHLIYDNYRRGSFLSHVFLEKFPWKDLASGRSGCSSFLKGGYSSSVRTHSGFITCDLARRSVVPSAGGASCEVGMAKRVMLGEGPAVMFSERLEKYSSGRYDLRHAVEFNFLVWDKKVISRQRLLRTDALSLKDMYSGTVLDFYMDKKYTVYARPVYTVNETEIGLKKMFQGISVFIGNDIVLDDQRGSDRIKVTIAIG